MRLATSVLIGLTLFAVPAQAQDFLGGLARRAAVSAAGQALGQAIAGQGDQTAPADPEDSAQPALSRRSLFGAPRQRLDNKPEAEGLQGLSDEARERACIERYPTNGLSGEAYLTQASHFLNCMPPGYGEGG